MIYHDLCSILALGLQKKPIKLNKGIELDKLCILASKQGISALLFSFIKNELNPNDKEYKFLYNSYLATLQKGALLENEFNNIINFAEECNIDLITYKGSILKNYYPDKYLRLMGDIDFQTDKKNIKKIHNFMKRNGYKLNHEFGNHHEYNKKPYFDIEYHESLHEKEFNLNVFDDYLENTISYNDMNHVKTFNNTYHLLYLITHLYQHIVTNGAGIRNYIDIYYLIKSCNDIDITFILDRLNQIGLKEFGETTFSFIVKAFDFNIKFKPLNDKDYDDYLNLVFKGGIYGVYSNYERELIRLSLNEETKGKYLLKRLFPSVSEMKNQYKSLSKWYMIIFLPFYYVYRIFSALFRSKASRDRIKLLNKNKNEVLKSKELYSRFGIKKI